MKHPLPLTLTVIAMALASCDSKSQLTAADVSTEIENIENLESEWSMMYGSDDLEGIMNLLAQDSVLIMPGADPVIGAENIRQVTQEMLASDDEVSWKSTFASVAPSGDMAYDYGTATTRLADGTEIQGYYLVVWVKEDGQWKVAADMFN